MRANLVLVDGIKCMENVLERGHNIFEKESVNKNVLVYRGIMEMMARFGYVSIREVMYGLKISIREAINRLNYLYRQGFINRFKSGTIPQHFYCLTQNGRDHVKQFLISDEIREFQPSRDYNLMYQNHDRLLVKSWSCLKRMFGQDFLGWVSENQLRQEYVGKGERVMDGEFYLKMSKKNMIWRCGLELELTLKGPNRYHEQFEALSQQVYEGFFDKNVRMPMIFFLYSGYTVLDRLKEGIKNHDFGNCIFYFAQVDEFLLKEKECPVEMLSKLDSRVISAKEMNQYE